MGFRDINIKHIYTGRGEKILEDFLLPAVSASVDYDRITSFYTVDSLLAVSQGIDALYRKKGRMRLIIGSHSVPSELVEAHLNREALQEEISQTRAQIAAEIRTISDLLALHRLATLAWMIEDGLLEVKVASILGNGLFHPKTIVLTDENGDKVIAVGSPNETRSGLGGNIEQIMVAKSWEHEDVIEEQEAFFDSLWDGAWEDITVFDITEDTKDLIRENVEPRVLERKGGQKTDKAKGHDLFSVAANMPMDFFVSGKIPALYMHQERAVIDALSRWPVRVLFADEVGLGKTFEVAATIVFMKQYYGIGKAVILAPKSVQQQWQDELIEHFGLEAWLFDSSKKQYSYPGKDPISIPDPNVPLYAGRPDIVIISAQYARGNKKDGNLFERRETELPDVLVLDEAHSARVSTDISGKKKKTLMYQMLEKITSLVPHIIFATATPMQREADEYHSLLSLLGLPKLWQKKSNYDTSLRLISSEEPPDLSDAYNAYMLLKTTLNQMRPSLKVLTKLELDKLTDIINASASDRASIGGMICEDWNVFRSIFVKLHPAHLLTVRNTRKSLEMAGYRFPKRNLLEVSINDSIDIEMFYQKVDKYLSEDCFKVEEFLYPDRNISIGFVRVSYRQRVASSLYSCRDSLERRLEKLLSIKEQITSSGYTNKISKVEMEELDDIDSDDLLVRDEDPLEISLIGVDITQLLRAAEIEITHLNSLIKEVSSLLETKGDPKIDEAIRCAVRYVEKNQQVLVFSRYTDTVDALIRNFLNGPYSSDIGFGIYTGQRCEISLNGKLRATDKNDLKDKLFSGDLKIVFCSDAASEGLNLQAARVLINVDVPWTPARLEQRIGRIARLGQKAKEVDVCNIWYPNSIEARMYHRIQMRFKATMLAVGEYPQVIANEIVTAVIENREESISTLNSLNAIRTSTQMKALESLWMREQVPSPKTKEIREEILEILKKHYICALKDNDFLEITDKDGSTYRYTAEPGLPETIALNALLLQNLNYSSDQYDILYGHQGDPVVFKRRADNALLQTWGLLKDLLGEKLNEEDLVSQRPSLLPDITDLDLSFSTSTNERPLFDLWI